MTKKRKLLVGLCVSCLTLVVPFAINEAVRGFQTEPSVVQADADFSHANELPDKVSVGATVTLPEGKITVDGQEYVAYTSVLSPSGILTETDEFKATESGEYTIEYYVVKNNVRYEYEHALDAEYTSFSVTNSESSISYGTYESKVLKNPTGLMVSLVSGDALSYNNPIDITDNVLGVPFLTLTPTPTTMGEMDAGCFYIEMTDLYNPDCKIIINNKAHNGWKLTTFQGSVNNGLFVSSPNSANATYNWLNTNIAKHETLSFSYDSTSKCMYLTTICMPYVADDGTEVAKKTRRTLIANFGDAEKYGADFNGFESGKILVKMYAGSYNKATYNFVVSEFDGETIAEDVLEQPVQPSVPKLEIDLGGYTQAPHGIMGRAYPIFDAVAYPYVWYTATLEARVYYGYHGGSPVEIPITNGTFPTKNEGVYTIVYKATDSYGETAIETVDVIVRDNPPLKVTVDEPTEALIVEKACNIGKIKVESSYDANSIELTAKAVLVSNPNISYDVIDGTFTPYVPGEYKILITCKDFAEETVTEITRTVMYTDKPVVQDVPVLPKYLIKNATYTFPDLSGMVYTAQGGSAVKANIFVVEDNAQSEKAVANNKYKVEASSQVKVIYRLNNGNVHSEYSKMIPVVDANYGIIDPTTNYPCLDMTKYFYVLDGDVAITAPKEEDRLLFTVGTEGGRAEFIRELLVNGFELVVHKMSDDTTLNVYVTDRINPNERIKLTYVNDQGTTYFYLNDEKIGATDTSLVVGTLTLEYSWSFQEISYAAGKYAKIAAYCNGQPFNGFSSREVYVEVEVPESETGATFGISKICGQPLSYKMMDLVLPYYETDNYTGGHSIGQTVTLPATKFSDVLDPDITISITVTSPNGKPVTSVDGVLLQNLTSFDRDYQIVLSEYGRYGIAYTVIDTSGNRVRRGWAITVFDEEPPKITLSDVVRLANVGDTIKIAKVTIEDNVDEPEDVYVFYTVRKPNGDMMQIYPDATSGVVSLDCEAAGIYTITVYALDGAGQTARVEYTVLVN